MLSLPIGENGRPKKVHVLLVTLSHSLKSCVNAVFRQNSEGFLRNLENAFRHSGGVPERLCPDNLKAAVSKADWYEPELRDFVAHYETVILPSRPRTPTNMGKVEAELWLPTEDLGNTCNHGICEIQALVQRPSRQEKPPPA